MNAETRPVILDLNNPDFQDQLFRLEHSEYKKVAKTFRKIKAMNWSQIFVDAGLNYEAIKSSPGEYSIRLSDAQHAIVRRERDAMCFLVLSPDHDATYGRK